MTSKEFYTELASVRAELKDFKDTFFRSTVRLAKDVHQNTDRLDAVEERLDSASQHADLQQVSCHFSFSDHIDGVE